LVGEANGVLGTLEEDIASRAQVSFTRPIDVDTFVETVRTLLGPGSSLPSPPSMPPSLRPSRLTPSASAPASRRSPGPWDDGADAEPQELDELSAAEPVASQPPEPAVSSSRPPAAHLELSAEITQLLADAERRVAVELR